MIPLGLYGAAHVPAAGGSAYATAVLADSPLLYLPLSESSAPAANLGSHGSTPAAATSWPTFGAGGIGDGATSADFPASTSVGIDIGSPVASASALTISTLVRIDNLSTGRVIAAFSSSYGTALRFEVSSEGKLRWLGSTWPTIITGATTLATDTTYHVAVTNTGAWAALYVNGALDGSGTSGTNRPLSGMSWTVGRALASGFELPMDGLMAGFTFYGSTLTAARLLAHAQAAGVA